MVLQLTDAGHEDSDPHGPGQDPHLLMPGLEDPEPPGLDQEDPERHEPDQVNQELQRVKQEDPELQRSDQEGPEGQPLDHKELIPCQSYQTHPGNSSELSSSCFPPTPQVFIKLIHFWPDFNIEIVPQFIKALIGLLASNYMYRFTIELVCLKPGFLWIVAIALVSHFTCGIPTCDWFTRSLKINPRNTKPPMCKYIWWFLPFLCVLKCLLDSNYRYSSVWCNPSQQQLRTCHFINLYYKTFDGFLFLLDESSVISGIQDVEEFKHLKLSPIADHKGLNMKITMVRSSDFPRWIFLPSLGFYDFIEFIEQPHFALHRFKPDNLMHVVHDDLIPLYFKFREIFMGDVLRVASTTNLFFVDTNDHGPYSDWYGALSSTTPLLAKELSDKMLYCFSSLYTGPSNTSFFQYGFGKPQGPIGPNLIGRDIAEFKQYYLDYFGVRPNLEQNQLQVTLISRRVNRKIVNEDEVLNSFTALANRDEVLKGKSLVVYKGDLMTNMKGMIRLVASSSVVVAMHGAETILSLFLPQSSVFIEMFPFGISKENVSPIYSLSKAPGVHFRYMSWNNLNEKNSIVHPEYPKEFGGVEELPDDLRQNIHAMKHVPAVECCQNPFYLFRMYQDTIIDESFHEVAAASLAALKSKPNTTVESQWYFPGPVRNLNCHRHPDHVNISWTAPHNIANLPTKYDVTVSAGSFLQNVVTNRCWVVFDLGEDFGIIQVWVLSEVRTKKSIDSYVLCE